MLSWQEHHWTQFGLKRDRLIRGGRYESVSVQASPEEKLRSVCRAGEKKHRTRPLKCAPKLVLYGRTRKTESRVDTAPAPSKSAPAPQQEQGLYRGFLVVVP